MQRYTDRFRRRGMTLIELLVVVMIMVILLGIALPLMKPVLADRKIREASRQLNAFIRAAQARAAQSNRSVGISFSRTDDVDRNISYQVYYAETPAPYVGDTGSARLSQPLTMINPNPPSTAHPNPPPWLCMATFEGAFALMVKEDNTITPPSVPLIQRGDRIRFNYGGPEYVIYDIYSNSPLASNPGQPNDLYPWPAPQADPVTGQAQLVIGPAPYDLHAMAMANAPHPTQGPILPGAKFQIFRKPQRTTAGSLTLPNGTAVILSLSGFDGATLRDTTTGNLLVDRHEFQADPSIPNPPGDTSPVTIMFRPDGSVEQVFFGGGSIGQFADSPIHLLVGSSLINERLPPAAFDPGATQIPPATGDQLTWQNLNDMNNLWVTIGERTGSITTSPMQEWQPLYVADATNPDRDTLVQKTRYARALTASGQSVGGK